METFFFYIFLIYYLIGMCPYRHSVSALSIFFCFGPAVSVSARMDSVSALLNFVDVFRAIYTARPSQQPFRHSPKSIRAETETAGCLNQKMNGANECLKQKNKKVPYFRHNRVRMRSTISTAQLGRNVIER